MKKKIKDKIEVEDINSIEDDSPECFGEWTEGCIKDLCGLGYDSCKLTKDSKDTLSI